MEVSEVSTPAPGDGPAETPPTDSPPSGVPPAREAALPRWVIVIGALVVLAGIVLRFVTRSDLWLDEALTVNISKLPLSDLHEALRQDGAPPLFYLLLHGWISVFGSSDLAVRSLSGVLSVATLPAIWFAGRRLGRPGAPGPIAADPPGARLAAGLAVIVVASNPFAIRYGTEARMYALVMLLVTLGYLALRRALEDPSLLRLAIVAVLAAALLYSQYWTMYLLAVVGIAMLWRAFRAPDAADRHAARGVVVAMIAALIIFSPWVPTFVFQSAHTGTPWGAGEIPFSTMRIAFDQFGNGTSLVHTQANLLAFMFVVLVLLGVFGRARGTRNIDVDLRTQPAVRWEAAAGFGALAVGLIIAWISNSAFDARYASMMFPLFALVVAFGFMAFGSRPVMAVVLAVLVIGGFFGAARNVTDNRTQAAQVADVINAEAKPGDVVLYCPDQLAPAVNRLLDRRADLDQVTFPRLAKPALVDWIDYQDHIDATDPGKFADDVLARAGKNGTIWYVNNPGYHGLDGKCEQVSAAIEAARPGLKARVIGDVETFFEADNLLEFPPA